MIEVVRYSEEHRTKWDMFIEDADNTFFFFNRNYMDYHSDRFLDFSLLIFDKKKLKALVPGNIIGKKYFSHQGLTFGGILHKHNTSFKELNEYYSSFLYYLQQNNCNKLTLKTIPFFYFSSLNQTHDYIFQKRKDVLVSKNIGAFINCKTHIFPKSSIEKRKLKLEIFKEDLSFSIDEFWKILEYNLKEQHNNTPVHTLQEIKYLKSKFPDKIKLFSIRNTITNQIEAGTLLYDDKGILKMQYIATSKEGRLNRASHALYYLFISKFLNQHNFIDMGTCMTDSGINEGLLYLKQRFGASIYINNIYTIIK